ncbi:adaptin N terminal region-domain-containing protein [Tricharina praecox]|uniref:adaptin N terminal region-domain-containing protein n=1 Tax=Tricharina praecox TaxID=43433 RepID=UPI00221E9F0D|nr:adaptin N terminal region-domain-containing protein [Tricharina praecox]KAI5849961.1 adaptin N terminal region-domain-containing protein [Tricharina praecox]
MFEKSLYDLIRGLRSNKGNERNYMLESLKECRAEAKSQDLDIKATAILKLIYLDMFGHDMSWASFHVLEVMSSPKFRQKRVGYLAAVQSFRLETDVLMLTTNLIKKDLFSPSVPEMSLAMNGLSHIVSPSLAADLAPDLVSKLTHSSPHVRKKAIPVLYKCFLQSPELLRTCWPRLRECLNDEDSSVVSATVNVVCELARRNPKNYLPLAPQLFKLLTDGGNNWMTIKLIKLFATLTPLEPRLVKKLVPPITNLIRTTPAMSLLYECISGLISGGLLESMKDTDEGEELASVCVTKLRGFLVEGDSNLKYVGLIALTKLVKTHAHLVCLHHDVVLDCIDDDDISIRYRALELVVGMVNSDTLSTIVGKLMRQLKPTANQEFVELEGAEEIPSEDEDDMEEQVMHPRKVKKGEMAPLELPEDYKHAIITRILEMCSREMYVNISDFEWYIDVLLQLVRYAPAVQVVDAGADEEEGQEDEQEELIRRRDVGENIGKELRNVAIRVKSVRQEAVRCAEMLVSGRDGVFPAAGGGGKRVLGAAGWIVGEYASLLTDPASTFDALVQASSRYLPSDILAVYIQAIAKIYAALTGSDSISWVPERKAYVTLLTERIIRFLEPLATSPNLEVQERAVEFLELFRLALEAIAAQPASFDTDTEQYDPPLLLTQAIPSLFYGQELNPVAQRAQRKVPLPPGLDLDEAINPNLADLIVAADYNPTLAGEDDKEDEDFRAYYYTKPSATATKSSQPASLGIDSAAATKAAVPGSYQNVAEEDYLDADILARRRRERQERNRDDPFYIFAPGETDGVTDADLEAIPVLELKLDDLPHPLPAATQPRERERIQIVGDEGLDGDDGEEEEEQEEEQVVGRRKRKGKGLLQVDASGLVGYSLEGEGVEDVKREEARAARKEVDRLRKEMEAAAERIAAQRKSLEMVEKKKKKPKKEGEVVKKKGKKKAKDADAGKEGEKEAEGDVKKKKKKKSKKAETAPDTSSPLPASAAAVAAS